MATYCNQHWLLSHIRNSFISTDDTGMCETVMLSYDMPKQYLRKFQTGPSAAPSENRHQQQQQKSATNKTQTYHGPNSLLQEVDFMCYPGLDQSDDEDIDLTTQSFEIQMYPEVGVYRLRSNTAQKLEKMDIARRKAAKTKCVNYDDEIVPPDCNDFFVRKPIRNTNQHENNAKNINAKIDAEDNKTAVKSKLSLHLANSPKQAQNKFMEYARFDGTSQTGTQFKRINVFLNMLPERERNFPMKICVLASAKIIEVIGLVCYKATIQYPGIPLKSIRHYALYMTEDNDDMEGFPPLDNREPCSKFGFSHLTLAECRPLAQETSMDYHNLVTKSMTSEEDKARLAAAAVRSLQGIELNGEEEVDTSFPATANTDEFEERILSHMDMLEAPMSRSYRLNIIDKRFFKTEVELVVTGESIVIDQQNAKFWTKQKAISYPIDVVAHCEIVMRRHLKAILRIWLKSQSSSSSSSSSKAMPDSSSYSIDISGAGGSAAPHSPTSPGHYLHVPSPFNLFHSHSSSVGSSGGYRFKHYDFEGDTHTAEHILKKLNCILTIRSSEARRDFLQFRQRKLEKSQVKKNLKL